MTALVGVQIVAGMVFLTGFAFVLGVVFGFYLADLLFRAMGGR